MLTSKTLIGLAAAILLSGCAEDTTNQPYAVTTANAVKADTDIYFVTDWGTHFLVDKKIVDEISIELVSCLNNVAYRCEKCYGQEDVTAEELRQSVIECDNAYYDRIQIRQEPPTFYGYPKGTPDPYEEFWFCVHNFSGAYDLPPDTDVEDVRDAVAECLRYFPADQWQTW